MDVAVYGLIRSGTTLVSDLLTVRGRSLIISEPDLFVPWDERTVLRIHNTARQFGLPIREAPPRQAEYGTFSRYFEHELLPQLIRLEAWGIKQVQFLFWRELFQIVQPRHLILCLRDLREVTLSAFDLIGRMGLVFGTKQMLRDEAWVMTRLCHDVYELAAMTALPHFRLRYEDLATDKKMQRKLAEYVSLDALGTERLNLDGEPDSRSTWEQSKHENRVSASSLGRFLQEPGGPAKSIAERVWAILPGYSKHFGYAQPDSNLCAPAHSLATPNESGSNPVSQALMGWSAERPPEFEASFARRHARVAAARKIPPGSVVLDLGSIVPALQFMLPAGCRYIGSDVGQRFNGCLVADYNKGELPPGEGNMIVTVLGLLEHIEDVYGFIKNLRSYNSPILLTYHVSDDTQDIDRSKHGWKNNLSRENLSTLITEAGFRFTAEWAFDGKQSLLTLSPQGGH